ncbi:3-keto-disaccharide hydrolase [Planctomicrobium sp. SH664]|uniref:3-keto-disaccharide hydrolase n=1 Tax=Planctomicrobium sp. SH664 TaxID=3448125 RepID=UPI003F5C4048
MTSSSEWRQLPLIQDGKIDASWRQIGGSSFVVEDGLLKTQGNEQGLGMCIFTPEKFGDCQLRVVFKTGRPKGNSGVHVRIHDDVLKHLDDPAAALPSEDGKLTPEGQRTARDDAAASRHAWFVVNHGFEVQIQDNADEFHRTGSVYSYSPAQASPTSDPDGWQTMIITLDGPKIVVDLNGKEVCRFNTATDKSPERKIWYEPLREPVRPESGYIGLQAHGPGDVVTFREVSVRPLQQGK